MLCQSCLSQLQALCKTCLLKKPVTGPPSVLSTTNTCHMPCQSYLLRIPVTGICQSCLPQSQARCQSYDLLQLPVTGYLLVLSTDTCRRPCVSPPSYGYLSQDLCQSFVPQIPVTGLCQSCLPLSQALCYTCQLKIPVTGLPSVLSATNTSHRSLLVLSTMDTCHRPSNSLVYHRYLSQTLC